MDDVAGIADTSPTNILPQEILSQIFTFLPLADRKCVRLTRRSWYDCCACVKITKNEKFVFRTDPGVEHIAEVMLRSSSLLNLEFQGVQVRMLPANVWEACGLRIRELEFRSCQLDDKTIKSIILHCGNLTSLVITPNLDIDIKSIRNAYSLRLLNDFIQNGIRRPKMHTLSLYIEDDEHESVLRRIFLLHPCIKHFTFRLISDKPEFNDPFAMRLDKCLNPDTRLESLKSIIVSPRGPVGYLGTLVDETGHGFKLKYLDTSLKLDGISLNLENRIFNFFRSQRNLEVIKITLDYNSECKNLFYHILESCPNLREFYLMTDFPILLKPSEVSRFIACISKLKSLEFCLDLEDSGQVPSFCDVLPTTIPLNLTTLNWTYDSEDPDFCAAVLQRCSSLKHLHLNRCWDSTLQTIFQYLPELQTLGFDNAYDITEFGFTGRTVDGNEDGYSIKRLQRLKHLELRPVVPFDYEYCITERTSLELELPCLEFLSLNVGWYKQLSEEALNHFTSHLPELKVLAIDLYNDNDIEDTIRLCGQLNNLQRLISSTLSFRSKKWKEQVFESIFSACPSLRYISDCSHETIIRDSFTGVMHCRNCLKFKRSIFE